MGAHRAAVERISPMVLALLDEDDRVPAIRQLTPDHGSPGSRAHHDDIAVDVALGPLVGAMDLLHPARLLQVPNDVELSAHLSVDVASVEVHEPVDERDERQRSFEDRVDLPPAEKIFLFVRRELMERSARPRDGRNIERSLSGAPRTHQRRVKLPNDFEGPCERGFIRCWDEA